MLIDEQDNHLIELAVAGGASWIVTSNLADFVEPELRFPQIRIGTAFDFMASLKKESFL